MRFLLAAAVLVGTIEFAPTVASADDTPCASVGMLAESVMKRRQDGLSLQSTLDAVKAGVSAEGYSAMEEMVMAAYSEPLYATAQNKARAVGVFRDDRQLACMKLFKQP